MDTPDIHAKKAVDVKTKKSQGKAGGSGDHADEPVFAIEIRRSYNRGAFQQMSANKL